jgi:GNAT superfamily N-acetyltransferase
MTYEIIDVNLKNLDQIGLFCHQSKKKLEGYQSKIEWIKERFSEGLKYKILKVEERNKFAYRGFIEYIPSEFNWRGIKADNFMVIHCIWVIGRHKGKGYASEMIQMAVDDAKALKMNGVVAIAIKKGGWFPRVSLYEKLGFKPVDQFGKKYILYAKILNKSSAPPSFYSISDKIKQSYEKGITVLYTHQCPYYPAVLEDIEQFADNSNEPFRSKHITTAEEASKNIMIPYGPFSILCDGEPIPYKAGMRKKKLADLRS